MPLLKVILKSLFCNFCEFFRSPFPGPLILRSATKLEVVARKRRQENRFENTY